MKVLRKISLICFVLVMIAGSCYAQYVPKDKRKKKTPANQEQTTSPTPNNQPQKQKPKKERPSELSEMNFWQRLTFGGNFGFAGFGNDVLTADVSPLVGYRASEKVTVGLAGSYTYYRVRFRVNGQNLVSESNFYGARAFAQYFFIPEIFAMVDLEGLNGRFFDNSQDVFRRDWQFSPLVGAGLRQSFSNRGGFFFALLYNLNYNPDTSFRNTPWVSRVGFNF